MTYFDTTWLCVLVLIEFGLYHGPAPASGIAERHNYRQFRHGAVYFIAVP